MHDYAENGDQAPVSPMTSSDPVRWDSFIP